MRVAGFAIIAAIVAGNLALCAGWASTAEARMACCTDGHECPMHKGGSRTSGSKRVVSQAQADACCSASESQQSTQSGPGFVTVISSSVLGVGIVVPTPVPALVMTDGWRSAAPVPAAPVPRHVLLSVFLV